MVTIYARIEYKDIFNCYERLYIRKCGSDKLLKKYLGQMKTQRLRVNNLTLYKKTISDKHSIRLMIIYTYTLISRKTTPIFIFLYTILYWFELQNRCRPTSLGIPFPF